MSDGLDTIINKWSIDDAADAHEILDYIDALHDEAMRKHGDS